MVGSSCSKLVARGVAVALAAENADTMTLSENVVTVSILLARIFRMESTDSAATLITCGNGSDCKGTAINAVATATIKYKVTLADTVRLNWSNNHCHLVNMTLLLPEYRLSSLHGDCTQVINIGDSDKVRKKGARC